MSQTWSQISEHTRDCVVWRRAGSRTGIRSPRHWPWTGDVQYRWRECGCRLALCCWVLNGVAYIFSLPLVLTRQKKYIKILSTCKIWNTVSWGREFWKLTVRTRCLAKFPLISVVTSSFLALLIIVTSSGFLSSDNENWNSDPLRFHSPLLKTEIPSGARVLSRVSVSGRRPL